MSIKIFYLILMIFGAFCVDIPSDICSGISQGMISHPDPTRCTEFILCFLGTAHLQRCLRTNEIFHQPAQDCVPGNPETCEVYFWTPITTTQTKTTTNSYETTETEESSLTATRVTDSTMIPEITTESTTDNSSINVPTTDKYPTTTVLSSTITSGTPIHRCPPGGFGYIPHHTNCSRYFECIKGIRHLRFCPGGFLFDSVTLKCMHPEFAVCAGVN